MVYTADLKSAGRKAIRVRVPSLAPYRFSIMDNTVGFYPSNGSSILSRRTKLIKHSNICESGGMVYTADLKSAGRKAIRVRVPFLAPNTGW